MNVAYNLLSDSQKIAIACINNRHKGIDIKEELFLFFDLYDDTFDYHLYLENGVFKSYTVARDGHVFYKTN